ncbi:MAG: chemotaxis protein CheD [Vicinamibacterales bacterium]
MIAVAEAPVDDWRVTAGVARRKRIVVGIGEFAVSNDKDSLIVTHALGSCVAVCLWDPQVKVAGLIHVLLPDSRINLDRAGVQPAAFADTGIPLLFQTAYAYGVQKQRCLVRLVGGADVTGIGAGITAVGKRNILAARGLLWKNGVMLKGEAVGGCEARNVSLDAGDGRVQVTSSGREPVQEL